MQQFSPPCKPLILLFFVSLAHPLWASNELIAHWTMDDGSGSVVTDSVGSFDGTLVDLDPNVAWIEGWLGGAMSFTEGDTPYILVEDTSELDFGDVDFTLSMMIKYPEAPTTTEHNLLTKGTTGSDANPGTGNRYTLFHKSDLMRFEIDNDNVGKSSLQVDDTSFGTGEWVHLVAVRDSVNDQLLLYADGVLQGTAEDTSGDISSGESMTIGNSTSLSNPSEAYIDDVRIYSKALSQDEINNLYACWPTIGATECSLDVVLDWASGESGTTYNVYLGTDSQEVANADLDSPLLIGAALDTNAVTPGKLAHGQTYYWRVDQIDSSTLTPGDVWYFTTESYSVALSSVTVTAANFNTGNEPEHTIDGSGLDSDDQHSTAMDDMWLGAYGSDESMWLKFEFEQAYQLHEMWIWNFNASLEQTLGIGAKDIVLEASLDGITWDHVQDLQLSQATSTSDYQANNIVDFNNLVAQYIRMTIASSWSSTQYCGLSEVRFYAIPTLARNPQPSDTATDIEVSLQLSWKAGRGATSHEISFGKDEQAVLNQEALWETTSESYLNISGLDLTSTYYWQVTEVNETAVIPTWKGPLWSFSTQDYVTVDDFDSYDNACNRIYYAWKDGAGYERNEDCPNVTAYSGNGSNAYVGYSESPYAEQTQVRDDSIQSMPFFYGNGSGETSEAIFTPTFQDWTTSGITLLSLYFCGLEDEDNDPAQLYITINDTKILYDGDSSDLSQTSWTQWIIDLDSVATDLSQVTSLTLGVEGEGEGTLLFDDIRLYHEAPDEE